MSDYTPRTAEEHHSTLMQAVELELTHYGPQSLLEVIACIIESTEGRLAVQAVADTLHRVAYALPSGVINATTAAPTWTQELNKGAPL